MGESLFVLRCRQRSVDDVSPSNRDDVRRVGRTAGSELERKGVLTSLAECELLIQVDQMMEATTYANDQSLMLSP